jgi:hypothetical protein
MMELFGIDVTAGSEEQWAEWGERWDWHNRSFFIPPGLVEAVYGSERWPLVRGSVRGARPVTIRPDS